MAKRKSAKRGKVGGSKKSGNWELARRNSGAQGPIFRGAKAEGLPSGGGRGWPENPRGRPGKVAKGRDPNPGMGQVHIHIHHHGKKGR